MNAANIAPRIQRIRNFCLRAISTPEETLGVPVSTRPTGRKRTLLAGRWNRLLCFVADQADLAEQIRDLHAGKLFEERGNLRSDFRYVTGELVSAGGIAVTGRDDGDLVHFAEGLG